MAVRYYNHAGFICAMPIDSVERVQWADTCAGYLRRAGILYSWGLRYLILIAPILVAIMYPLAGPLIALMTLLVLSRFDRFSEVPTPHSSQHHGRIR
jgi:hypothetical protein